MMKPEFDPYDLLIECMERLQMIELKHNQLATAFQQTDQELTIALQSLKHLQQTHMITMSNQVKLEKRIQDLEALTK